MAKEEAKNKIWLYSAKKPKGELFELSKSGIKDLLEKGWVDSPAKVKKAAVKK